MYILDQKSMVLQASLILYIHKITFFLPNILKLFQHIELRFQQLSLFFCLIIMFDFYMSNY